MAVCGDGTDTFPSVIYSEVFYWFTLFEITFNQLVQSESEFQLFKLT